MKWFVESQTQKNLSEDRFFKCEISISCAEHHLVLLLEHLMELERLDLAQLFL
jgi:hypothetical protein